MMGGEENKEGWRGDVRQGEMERHGEGGEMEGLQGKEEREGKERAEMGRKNGSTERRTKEKQGRIEEMRRG